MDEMRKPQFIAVVPNEKLVVRGYNEIDSYICRTIISNPCPALLREIEEIAAAGGVSGILTRGSLAQYLYEHQVSLPIFNLKYDLASILDLLQDCIANGYRKIGLFEINYAAFAIKPEPISTVLTVGGCEIFYYRFFDHTELEETIVGLREQAGIDLVAGDVEPILIAQRLGIHCKHFIIGRESYYNAITEARYSSDISMKEKAQNDFVQAITNTMSEAVVVVDEQGEIKRYNLQARKFFPTGENPKTIQEVLGVALEDLLTREENCLTAVGTRRYIANVLPLLIGGTQHYAVVMNSVNYVEDLEMSIRKQYKEKGLTAKSTFESIICADKATRTLVEMGRKYARTGSTVLIYGETGAGKEVFASSIHNASLRADGPFVAINCATLTESLIESELFGYEKGSFTGALASGKQGLFELAHKGSIFLDEIGELPMNIQAKLLRVLQEKEIMRIGGDKIIPIDVRVIAATNKDLKLLVSEKRFRCDLYYRLALLELNIPPLRERRDDIVPLFTSFLAQAAERESRSLYWEDTDVFQPLLQYDWPGNVRELGNFAERVVLLCEGRRIGKGFVRDMMQKKCAKEETGEFVSEITKDLKTLESNYLEFLLRRFGGNKDQLCAYLNMSKSTLWRKLGYGVPGSHKKSSEP